MMMYSTDRYDSTTGTFTVSPGGDGFYYFSVYLLVLQSHVTVFDIEINGQIICTAYAEQLSSSDDENTSCTAVSYAAEGATNHLSLSCSLLQPANVVWTPLGPGPGHPPWADPSTWAWAWTPPVDRHTPVKIQPSQTSFADCNHKFKIPRTNTFTKSTF